MENTAAAPADQTQQTAQTAGPEATPQQPQQEQPQQPQQEQPQQPQQEQPQQSQQAACPMEDQNLGTSDIQILEGCFMFPLDSIIQQSEHVHDYSEAITYPATERNIAGIERYVSCCGTIIGEDALNEITWTAASGEPCPYCGQSFSGYATRFVYNDVVVDKVIGYKCSCGFIIKSE